MNDTVRKLKRKLKASDEIERCGVVLADGKLIALPNHHPKPTEGFAMIASDLKPHLDKIVGFWHTHPSASSLFSQEDYLGFGQWPGYINYIVGTDGVRAYQADEAGLVSEVDLASD